MVHYSQSNVDGDFPKSSGRWSIYEQRDMYSLIVVYSKGIKQLRQEYLLVCAYSAIIAKDIPGLFEKFSGSDFRTMSEVVGMESRINISAVRVYASFFVIMKALFALPYIENVSRMFFLLLLFLLFYL